MLDYSACCCQGGRPYNEDSIGISDSIDPIGTFALADGLGGHGMGDIASASAVKCVMEGDPAYHGNDFLAHGDPPKNYVHKLFSCPKEQENNCLR